MARYTLELLAALRRRYEDTNQPLPSIATEFEISTRTLYRIAASRKWRKRANRPPRGIPSAVRLLEEARALERSVTFSGRPAESDAAAGAKDHAALERIERQVTQQLEALTIERGLPGACTAEAGERRSRWLAMIAESFAITHALRRKRFGSRPVS